MSPKKKPLACDYCRERRRKCEAVDSNPRTCANCKGSGRTCSLASSGIYLSVSPALAGSLGTPEQKANLDSQRLRRAISSATASSEPGPSQNIKKARTHSIYACEICQQERIVSNNPDGDSIKGKSNEFLICSSCLNSNSTELVEAVEEAEIHFKRSIGRIKDANNSIVQGDATIYDSISADSRDQHAPEGDNQELIEELHNLSSAEFEPAKDERFRSFQSSTIRALLSKIEDAVFEYDNAVRYANELFLDTNDALKEGPLQCWAEVDRNYQSLGGEQWFQATKLGNNLSERHSTITSALRDILRIPDDKPLLPTHLSHKIKFSDLQKSLINWFVMNVLSGKFNLYDTGSLKGLRATQKAVARFGNSHWKSYGRRVRQEIQLRAWHDDQFKEDLLICREYLSERLEVHLAPLTKKLGRINPLSEHRSKIIRYTVELWAYLDAAQGRFEFIIPEIGSLFDGKTCKSIHDAGTMHVNAVTWVIRPGFTFQENVHDGQAVTIRAIVI